MCLRVSFLLGIPYSNFKSFILQTILKSKFFKGNLIPVEPNTFEFEEKINVFFYFHFQWNDQQSFLLKKKNCIFNWQMICDKRNATRKSFFRFWLMYALKISLRCLSLYVCYVTWTHLYLNQKNAFQNKVLFFPWKQW